MLCIYLSVCVCVCCPHHVCLLFSQWLPLKEAREGGKKREKWVRERDRDEKNEENSGNSLQQDKYPQLGVTRPPHSLLLHTHTHTHADYRVNMCNLINQPLFGRRKKQTHIHNMQTQTCWLWRKWTCEVISQVRSHTCVLMAYRIECTDISSIATNLLLQWLMDQIISKGASGVTYSFCIILHKAKKKKKARQSKFYKPIVVFNCPANCKPKSG